MKKLLPHPMLSLLVLALWFALNDGAPASLLPGAILAYLLPRYTQRFSVGTPATAHPGKTLLLLGILLQDIVIASLQVARLVLGPAGRARPDFVEVRLDLRDPFVATLLGGMVTLTPGTVAIDVDQERWVMLVHALDVADRDALVESIKTRYEARLREIFSC